MTYHDFPWLEDGPEDIIEHARRYCVTHKLTKVFTPVNSKDGVMVALVDFSGPVPRMEVVPKEQFPIDFEKTRDEANKMNVNRRVWGYVVGVLCVLAIVAVVFAILVASQGENKLKAIATKDFIDPSSVQWRNTNVVNYKGDKALCGEVNGKNTYGAYVGFKRVIATDFNFVVTGRNADLMWDEMGCPK